ncbi:MAG: rod-binding protein [Deltaproteobacteria bacterium]|jgi:flagellar protein FlgJ|nr:rod-binding protein [Deltaproteobacteria bacterium]
MSDTVIKQTLEIQPPEVNHRMDQVRRVLSTERPAAEAPTDSELEKACQEMESIFLNFLLKEMRNTINKSGFISGGTAENIYTGMLDAEISKVIAARGSIGLSKILYEQLGKDMEKKPDQGD